MKKLFAWLLLAAYAATVAAQTTLSGPLSGMILDSTGNPFIVEKEIVVPKGKSLTINPGCILLFKPFSGLTVNGNCSVLGTSEHPVVFTSANDSAYNKASTQPPNPFDWNGIVVARESGEVVFNYVKVRFSVFGIKSQNPDILISQGIFKQNGQFHFTVNDQIESVQDDLPFSYKGQHAAAAVPQPQASAHPLVKKSKPSISPTRAIVRYSLLGVGVAGSVVGMILSLSANTKYSDLKELADVKAHGLPAPGVFPNKRDSYNATKNGAIITDLLGGLGFIGFGLTFVF